MIDSTSVRRTICLLLMGAGVVLLSPSANAIDCPSGNVGDGCSVACPCNGTNVCDLFTCRASKCDYCESDFGNCCGAEGEVSCLGTGTGTGCNYGCGPGLELRGGSCKKPCSYCRTELSCCGDNNQVSCAGIGEPGNADVSSCNGTCKTGYCFDPGTARCEPCDSCDDDNVFTLGACGKSYERYCATGTIQGCSACESGYYRDNGYFDYIGTANCQPSFLPSPETPPASGFDFTFFVVTDVEVGDIARGKCSPTSAYGKMTDFVNNVAGTVLWPDDKDSAGQFLFEKHGQAIDEPLGVVHTGDMTHRGSSSAVGSFWPEMRTFMDYWEERRGVDPLGHSSAEGPSVIYPVYPGRGNHDEIKCRGAYNASCAVNASAKNHIHAGYLHERLGDESSVSFDHGSDPNDVLDSSANYSWDWGPVHLIQGNQWAGEENLTWLADDLASSVGNSGHPVILFQHYGWDVFSAEYKCASSNTTSCTKETEEDDCEAGVACDVDSGTCANSGAVSCVTDRDCESGITCEQTWWSDDDRQDLADVLAGYNVIGIFTGHTHSPGLYESTAEGGFVNFIGDDGGDDDDCDDSTKNSDVEGDGGILVVRIADDGNGGARFEVVQLQWDEGMSSASEITTLPAGRCSDCENRLSPTSARTVLVEGVPPVAACANQTVSADASCLGDADIDNGSTDPDAQAGEMLTCTQNPLGLYARGTTNVDLECVDVDGLVDLCSATATVEDDTAPVITCPSDQTAECTGAGGADPIYAATAADNCDGSPSVSCSPGSGATFSVDGTPANVTCSATDADANSSSCTFAMDVVDTTPPAITCPGDQVLECQGFDGAVATFAATADDVCRGALTPGCNHASGAPFVLGTTTVGCDVSDADANASSCSFQIEVEDTTKPIVTRTGPERVELHYLLETYVEEGATATDICDSAVPVVIGGDVVDVTAPGTYLVTYDATDDSGNTADQVTRTVEVFTRFAVFATQSVWLKSESVVEGDVGVLGTGAKPYLGSDAQVVLGGDAAVVGNVYANDLKMRSDSVVLGTILYNTVDFGTPTTVGATVTSVPVPLADPSPALPSVAAGSTSLTVAAKRTTTLPSGAFGGVKIEAGTSNKSTVLRLSGGDYHFASLEMGAHSRVECDAPCNVLVGGRLEPGKKSYFGPSSGSGLVASDVTLFVGASDGASGSQVAAAFGNDSEVHARVHVPNGTLKIKSGTDATGRLIAAEVMIGEEASVTFE